MPIELIWLIADKILLSRWMGDIGDEDMRVMIGELEIVLNNALSPIHTVLDMSEVGHISSSVFYLYLQSSIPTHPHRGRIGAVKPTVEGEILADLLNRISQREMICFFRTREEARDFLLGNDSPPPPLTFGPDWTDPSKLSTGKSTSA